MAGPNAAAMKRFLELARTKSATVSLNRAAAMLVALAALILLIAPIWLVGTAHFSDVVMYVDAGWRVRHGQIPHVDFFSPFGPLSTYLYALVSTVFSNANPVLASQYGVLLIATPLMMMAAADAPKRAALFLWIGFALFALTPANFLNFPEPFNTGGVDGHGIYNRQSALLLYVMAAALWWSPKPERNAVICAAVLGALAFIKVTACVAGGIVVLGALVAGRISLRVSMIAAAVLIAAMAALELSTHLVSAYIKDILLFTTAKATVSADNGISRKLVNAFNANIMAVLLLGGTILCLAIREKLSTAKAWSWDFVREAAGAPPVALGLALLMGLLLETQNNGAQPFIYVLPAALWIAMSFDARGGLLKAASLLAVMFIGVFVAMGAAKAVRVVKAGFISAHFAAPEVAPLRLSFILDNDVKAREWLDNMGRETHRDRLIVSNERERQDNSTEGGAPVIYAQDVADIVRLVRAWEAREGVQIRSVATWDFVDPVPWLMDLPPIPGLTTVQDGVRLDFRPYEARMRQGYEGADLILLPSCEPVKQYRNAYLAQFGPVLEGRRRIEFNGCWTGFVRQGLQSGAAASPPS